MGPPWIPQNDRGAEPSSEGAVSERTLGTASSSYMRMRGGPPMPESAERQPEVVAAIAPLAISSRVSSRHSAAFWLAVRAACNRRQQSL